MGQISLHENSIRRVSFYPEEGRLIVELEDPVIGANGERVMVFVGVQHVQVSGSTTVGKKGFIPSDEVLTLEMKGADAMTPEGVAARFLLAPRPGFVQQGTGISLIEVEAQRFELVASPINADDES